MKYFTIITTPYGMKKNRWYFAFETKLKRGLVPMLAALAMSDSLLSSCANDQMFEVTSGSSAQSKKDSVFLAHYHIVPSRIVMDDQRQLEIKEAFIEQRFAMNFRTGKKRLINSDFVLPKLVMITSKESNLEVQSTEFYMKIYDKRFLKKDEKKIFSSGQGPNDIIFKLAPVYVFIPQQIPIRVEVTNKYGNMKHFTLIATPVRHEER